MASCRYEMKVREQQESIRSQRKSQVWKCLYMLTRHSLVSENWGKGIVKPDYFWIQNNLTVLLHWNMENILTMKWCFCFNVVSLLSKPSLHNNSLIRIKSKLGLMCFLIYITTSNSVFIKMAGRYGCSCGENSNIQLQGI